jgi:pyrophosphatase PpaX
VNYACILFDWDGCLADTLDIWIEAYTRSLELRGIHAGKSAVVQELFNDWEGPERFGVQDVGVFELEILSTMEKRVPTAVFNSGALRVLKELHRCGRTTAVLTGSRRSFVEPVIIREGVESMVDLLVCWEDVTHPKPHPEAVERALATLAVPRERAIMVGDSTRDIQMGSNAGTATVLYFPNKNRRYYGLSQLERCRPDFVIRDFNDLLNLVV